MVDSIHRDFGSVKSGEGVGKRRDTGSKICLIPWQRSTSMTCYFFSRVHKITVDVHFGAAFVVDPKKMSTCGSTLV